MAATRRKTKKAKPVKIHRLTVRGLQRNAVLKTMVNYRPTIDTRFRCVVCGSMANEFNQCCGEEMRKTMLAGK